MLFRSVTSGGFTLVEGEYTLVTQVSDTGEDDHRAVSMLPGGGFVVLDTEVTPELAAEGLARDVVRAVQQARRDAGLDVSDRIALVLGGDASVRSALETHRDLVAREVLASSLEIGDAPAGVPTAAVGVDQQVQVALRRA